MIGIRGFKLNVVIMAGGRATRLKGVKKPLLNLCGRRLIDVVIGIAKELVSDGKVYICVSDYTKEITNESFGEGVEVVLCPGRGYVEDLNYILSRVKLPVLVLPSDLPFITLDIIRKFVELANRECVDVITLTVCSSSKCREVGISLFNNLSGTWVNIEFPDILELRDIDTEEDLKMVEDLCGSMGDVVR